MGLIKLIKRITGKDENSRIRKLIDRILILQKEKSSLDNKLNDLKSSPAPDLSWFKIHPSVQRSERIDVYSPLELKPFKTMKDLFDERKREEEEYLQTVKCNVIKSIDFIHSLLEEESVEKAENLLYQIAPIIKEAKDETLFAAFNNCRNDFEELKEKLLQREIVRIAREAREKAERDEQERNERIRLAEIETQKQEEREKKAREYEERIANEEHNQALEIARLTAEVTVKKENSQSYINYLNSKSIPCFYHFTDESNLYSIRKKGGLYSWSYCKKNNITIPNPGGDSQSRDLDCRHGLEDYVRLSFCRDHPMAWRKQQEGSKLVLLEIKIDVASFKDTQFSNVNAAANDCIHGDALTDLYRVNIDATQKRYVSKEDSIFHEHQAECMVKTFIPIEYIINIDNPKRLN